MSERTLSIKEQWSNEVNGDLTITTVKTFKDGESLQEMLDVLRDMHKDTRKDFDMSP